MAQVKLVSLTKVFGKVIAVNNLSLEIKNGEFIALLGPSGCGKTTTLLMIAGIYRPTKGEIYFDDILMNEVPPRDRHVGLVFQSYALYPHMTVYQNIAFPLRLAKRPKHEIDAKVREIARLTQIEDLLERKPSQLSGGQQQRVALCRALVKEPEVLLLDEPLSNLDARLRVETRAEIKRLQQELGITTILVTHDQVEAMTMAERVAVLHQGVLQQYGPPNELYDHPKNLFVAMFIGDPPMNLMHVQYKTKEGKPCFVVDEVELPLPLEWAQRIEQTRESEFVFGVRPEDVHMLLVEEDFAFPGKVCLLEPLGGGVLVHCQVGQTKVRVLVPREQKVALGDQIWLCPNWQRVHLFLTDGRTIYELAQA